MYALTFDDGPGPSTEALLDVLRAAGVRATFFLLGRNLEEAPCFGGDVARAQALARRAFSEGHVLGNHTYSHLRPDKWRELAADVRRGAEAVRRITGAASVPFRLPYGVQLVQQTVPSPAGTINVAALDPRLPVLATLGLGHQHWTADFDDWTMKPGDGARLAAAMLAHVESNAALGLDAVLDLHDSGTGSSFGYERPATVEGVRLFCAEAARRGWKSYTVP